MALLMAKRRLQRYWGYVCAVAAMYLLYFGSLNNSLQDDRDIDLTRRDEILRYIENKLQEELKLDKGSGCEIPVLDPFADEVTRLDKELPEVKCVGQDWVKCYHSRCRVVDKIKETVKDITCVFRDILFQDDQKHIFGPVTVSEGSYQLQESDHATVFCTGIDISNKKQVKWTGNVLGLRSVKPKEPPPGREDSFNVLIFGFDSTARNGFIRRMPKSWKVLTEELGATVMEGYNIVGDGTPAALFPILTGKSELELPDVRKTSSAHNNLDDFPFIFYKLKEDGYRTAYFEDMPEIGTFQYKFKGFKRPPADHYLRAFFLEEQEKKNTRWWKDKHKHCVGDTPQFKLMMNITEQFMELDGKRFAFTLIVGVTHNDFNMIKSADDDTAALLRNWQRHSEDTLLVVMGDHGPRFAKYRKTVQGKLEERLPLMALLLPSKLLRTRPDAAKALRGNARVLTTPHDLHATLLDVLGMSQYANTYKVRGADLRRGLSMLEPIPSNRSCSEAGIEPHWCACVAWQSVPASDPLHAKAAQEFLHFINTFLKEAGSKCVPRTLTSTEWVLRQRPNSRLLSFVKSVNEDYVGHFGDDTRSAKENYQIKVVVGPGRAVFEASLTHVVNEDYFLIHPGDISRTNAYGNEPHCISDTHPHLNFFCYCRH
ncbi:uncharacterized protein [Choristoneura fumiferana]|uniref:uncharacterized protein n=1 Tax=Choristoneura fumiferana TaxID=7141 RepID=UPI003D158CF9